MYVHTFIKKKKSSKISNSFGKIENSLLLNRLYASLAMHSKAHQEIFKETSILGMCIGERKEELTNDRKLWRQTVHGCTCNRLNSTPHIPLETGNTPFFIQDFLRNDFLDIWHCSQSPLRKSLLRIWNFFYLYFPEFGKTRVQRSRVYRKVTLNLICGGGISYFSRYEQSQLSFLKYWFRIIF